MRGARAVIEMAVTPTAHEDRGTAQCFADRTRRGLDFPCYSMVHAPSLHSTDLYSRLRANV